MVKTYHWIVFTIFCHKPRHQESDFDRFKNGGLAISPFARFALIVQFS